MLSNYDDAIKARFLAYLEQEMSFVARHPGNTRRAYTAAVALIDHLTLYKMISVQERETLLDGLDQALLLAIKARQEQRGD